MESNSTPDFVIRIVNLNKKNIKVEDIDIEEVDRALDEELAVKEEEFLRQVDTEIELDSGLEGFDQQEGVEDVRGVATALGL